MNGELVLNDVTNRYCYICVLYLSEWKGRHFIWVQGLDHRFPSSGYNPNQCYGYPLQSEKGFSEYLLFLIAEQCLKGCWE